MHKAIHIYNSLQPLPKLKIAKEYVFANATDRMDKSRKNWLGFKTNEFKHKANLKEEEGVKI